MYRTYVNTNLHVFVVGEKNRIFCSEVQSLGTRGIIEEIKFPLE